tara:strand:+ start:15108 stop:15329 length:222 start_codon:yes stop_codon:yes gene_type:complete
VTSAGGSGVSVGDGVGVGFDVGTMVGDTVGTTVGTNVGVVASADGSGMVFSFLRTGDPLFVITGLFDIKYNIL